MRYDEDEEPRGRGRALGWIVGLVLLVIAAATLFRSLAPPEYKARVGISEVGRNPARIDADDQRPAKIGERANELLAISGRIIYPTRPRTSGAANQGRIAKQDNQTSSSMPLDDRAAGSGRCRRAGVASFNSAEVDIPERRR